MKPRRILHPPRPKGKINPSVELPIAEKSGKYVAQRKFNGDRTLMYVSTDGEILLYDRRGKLNRYQFSPEQKKEVLESLLIQKGCEYWLDGELLHYKTKNIKDTLVFFDLLWQERFLYGCNQMERLERLWLLCGSPATLDTDGRALYVSPTLRLAEVFQENFASIYQESFDLDWCEGLVLRDRTSSLDTPCHKIDEEVRWQKRCRKPSKSYSH